MYLVRIEPTELILVGTWLIYQAIGDAGLVTSESLEDPAHFVMKE